MKFLKLRLNQKKKYHGTEKKGIKLQNLMKREKQLRLVPNQ